MTDSKVVTLGFANFDLNYLLNSDNPDFGDQETLNLKKSLSTLVLPYTWQLNDFQDNWSQALTVRAFYIKVARDNQLPAGSQ